MKLRNYGNLSGAKLACHKEKTVAVGTKTGSGAISVAKEGPKGSSEWKRELHRTKS